MTSINLVLSTARPVVDPKSDNKSTFEIVRAYRLVYALCAHTSLSQLTPDQSKYVLRASSPEEMNDWCDHAQIALPGR